MTWGVAKVLKREKAVLGVGLLVLLSFLVIAPLVGLISETIFQNRAEGAKRAMLAGISAEQAYSLRQAEELASSSKIAALIEAGDAAGLIAALDEEKDKRDLGSIVGVNREGIALFRVPAVANYGDFVFQTLPWGQAAARGRSVTTVGAGRSFPLVIVAAHPMRDAEGVSGAIFTGYWLDNPYSIKFRSKYLEERMQIAFYSKHEGVLGTSFDNEISRRILLTAFNAATDWIMNAQSGQVISLGRNNYYYLSNVTLEGLDEAHGGALLFMPLSHPSLVSLVISLLTSLIFLGLALETHRRHGKERFANPYVMPAMITLSCALVFSGTFVINDHFLTKDVVRLEEQSQAIYNSSIRLAPESGTFDMTSQQVIDVQILTGGEAINAVQAEVSYDPAILRVEDILMEKSFCQPEFLVQRSIDNVAGRVSLICGLPSPGLTSEIGRVATLVVQPVASGNTALRFEKGTRVLANDGLGTNVLRTSQDAGYRIEDFRRGAEAAEILRALPFSFSHPNPERWYSRKNILLDWPVTKGASYAYALDQNPTAVPDKEAPASGNLALNVPTDGIYYFHLQAAKGDLKSPVADFKLKIDTTPPPPPMIRASSLKIRAGEVVRFEFGGRDDLSGVQANYYAKIDNSILLPVQQQVYVPFLKAGKHSLTLRVFDNAGNFSDSSVDITVTK